MPQISTIQKSLPRYQCHKKVSALKIAKVEESTVQPSPFQGGSYTLTPEDASYSPFDVSAHWFEKFLPRAGGYYVVYEDGYSSFSPAKAFEEGYTEIK